MKKKTKYVLLGLIGIIIAVVLVSCQGNKMDGMYYHYTESGKMEVQYYLKIDDGKVTGKTSGYGSVTGKIDYNNKTIVFDDKDDEYTYKFDNVTDVLTIKTFGLEADYVKKGGETYDTLK